MFSPPSSPHATRSGSEGQRTQALLAVFCTLWLAKCYPGSRTSLAAVRHCIRFTIQTDTASDLPSRSRILVHAPDEAIRFVETLHLLSQRAPTPNPQETCQLLKAGAKRSKKCCATAPTKCVLKRTIPHFHALSIPEISHFQIQ